MSKFFLVIAWKALVYGVLIAIIIITLAGGQLPVHHEIILCLAIFSAGLLAYLDVLAWAEKFLRKE